MQNSKYDSHVDHTYFSGERQIQFYQVCQVGDTVGKKLSTGNVDMQSFQMH